MPRAFRFQPPSLPGQLVVRRRLLDLLEKRWDRRVTTVVAGPGFGKTSLLAAAVASDDGQGGRDVWLSCEPRDESGEHLVAGLAESMGVPGGGDLDAVLDAVWAVAPTEVCLVLDDVHEVPPGSDGAAVLARMTTDLSANGHLVLASRDTVPVPLARLAATAQLVSIGEAELVFDAAELAAFAALHHVDPGLLAPTGGWPALVELTVGAPADLVGDFLWQEVLGRIGEERSRLLARFAAAGGGDDEIASALAGRPVSVDELVESVPLVERWPTGWAGLHPLWEPALRRVVTTEEAAEARRQAASVHRRLHRFNAAVELLVEAEAWDGVLEVIREAERERATPPTDRRPGTVDEPRVESADFGRWVRLLPPGWRRRP